MSKRRKVPACVGKYRSAVGFGEHNGDPRGWKRFMRKNGMSDPVYEAFTYGEAMAIYGAAMPKRWLTNPYPPGRRRDEYDRGRALDRSGSFAKGG